MMLVGLIYSYREMEKLHVPVAKVEPTDDSTKADAAAKIIQKVYRSYVQRRDGELKKSTAIEPLPGTVPQNRAMSVDAAAKIIQAGYRGYRQRRGAKDVNVEDAEPVEDEQEMGYEMPHADDVDEQQNEELGEEESNPDVD